MSKIWQRPLIIGGDVVDDDAWGLVGADGASSRTGVPHDF